DRAEGCKDALKNAGLDDKFGRNMSSGDYTHQSGYVAMNDLLKRMPEIDGVFVANDQMAVGALKALSEKGKKIPEDVKVIGYDNVFISSILEPSLSTVHVRKRHIGLEAVTMLLNRMEDDTPRDGEAVVMETKVVVRKSTSKNAIEDWILADW
ncbi:MAG: substrate-binding domain-containing protein, partial [Lachnospiraceae bacterium]